MEETPTRIEPCLFEDSIPGVLADLSLEIVALAGNLGRGLHPDSALELAEFVRVMNCYYSNLIEGHKTRPRDIEKALAGAELDVATRPLALEAKAHVSVQRQIDALYFSGNLRNPTSAAFISWVHARFYAEMPDEFRHIQLGDDRRLEIVGGEFRSGAGQDVMVGRHQPPSADRIADFLAHFERRFNADRMGPVNRVVSIASAHHRLNFIHPFLDGNGRVSRLMSHAMALKAGIGGMGLWSISRGLARGLKDKSEYMRMMDLADSPRRGDLDGRGNLSLAALSEFCEWFLTIMRDQIAFSTTLFDLDTLERRYRLLVHDVIGNKHAVDIVAAVLRHGTMDRGDMNLVTKSSERTARTALTALTKAGFLKSATPKSPVRIAFPVDYRERLFPNLFAEAEPDTGP
jgi:Fic family protein